MRVRGNKRKKASKKEKMEGNLSTYLLTFVAYLRGFGEIGNEDPLMLEH